MTIKATVPNLAQLENGNKIAFVIFDRTDPVCKQKKTFLCKLLIVLEIEKYIKKSKKNVLIVSRIERILSKGN